MFTKIFECVGEREFKREKRGEKFMRDERAFKRDENYAIP